MNATRPKKKPAKKRNQIKARARKAELLKALEEAVQAAKGGKTKKAAKSSPQSGAKEKAETTKSAAPKAKESAPKADPKPKKEVKEAQMKIDDVKTA